MYLSNRYNEILLIVDTCEAKTLYKKIYSPNIIALTSSKLGESSLSHHSDDQIGVYVIDRFTYHLLNFLENVEWKKSVKTIRDLFKVCPKSVCVSTVNWKIFDMKRDALKIPVLDFFGGVRELKLVKNVDEYENLSSERQYILKTEKINLKDKKFINKSKILSKVNSNDNLDWFLNIIFGAIIFFTSKSIIFDL